MRLFTLVAMEKYKGNKEFFQDVVVVRPMMLSTIVVAMAKWPSKIDVRLNSLMTISKYI